MRAFHVVGVNLELRFRVRGCLIGEQDVLVGMFRVGLLRDGLHKDAAVEHTL